MLLVLLARSREIDINSIAFALILAGAAGNLIDRAMRGQVIDFIRVHYYDLNYPVFNIADSAITVGVTLVILASLKSSSVDSAASTPEIRRQDRLEIPPKIPPTDQRADLTIRRAPV